MRLKIVQAGERVLRQRSRDLTEGEIRAASFQELISMMRETMRDAPGVGLAAPQIGLGLRVAVIEDRQEYHRVMSAEQLRDRERQPVSFQVIVNPRITMKSERTTEFFEGCLSVAGFTALVARAHSVTVNCLNEHAEPGCIAASGWYARILQHEIDHLEGTLYVDHMHPRSFMTVDNFSRHWKDADIDQIRESFEMHR